MTATPSDPAPSLDALDAPDAGETIESLSVSLGTRSYRILIGTGWWQTLAQRIVAELGEVSQVLLIADAAVRDSWAEPLGARLAQEGVKVETLDVPSGEASKSAEQLMRLWQWMHQVQADRRSVVVLVGGGVVGDLGGFAAASYTRGLRLVQVPTTLLSQVDSSVGGKTAINLPEAKNMVGAFWQPALVAIDTDSLNTLSPRQRTSGWAEVVKYGMILDADFFRWLETHVAQLRAAQPAQVRQAIRRSCEIKAAVVGEDERETSGLRAVLNYGHTFGHAIEATAGYGHFLHGEAIAIGMTMAARLAVDLGRIAPETLERQSRLLEQLGLPTAWPKADADAMLRAMRTDKKVAHGRLRLILPTRIGHVELVDSVEESALRSAILNA